MIKTLIGFAAMLLCAIALMTGPSMADGAIGVGATCPMTGPAVAVCGGLIVVGHELTQMANGKQGFGPNGEIMKVLAVPVHIIDQNVLASPGESGVLAQMLRASTGISWRDIQADGIWGGPNSIFRKPFG